MVQAWWVHGSFPHLGFLGVSLCFVFVGDTDVELVLPEWVVRFIACYTIMLELFASFHSGTLICTSYIRAMLECELGE